MSATARLPDLTADELDLMGKALLEHLAMLIHAHQGTRDELNDEIATARSLLTAVAEARYSLR